MPIPTYMVLVWTARLSQWTSLSGSLGRLLKERAASNASWEEAASPPPPCQFKIKHRPFSPPRIKSTDVIWKRDKYHWDFSTPVHVTYAMTHTIFTQNHTNIKFTLPVPPPSLWNYAGANQYSELSVHKSLCPFGHKSLQHQNFTIMCGSIFNICHLYWKLCSEVNSKGLVTLQSICAQDCDLRIPRFSRKYFKSAMSPFTNAAILAFWIMQCPAESHLMQCCSTAQNVLLVQRPWASNSISCLLKQYSLGLVC